MLQAPPEARALNDDLDFLFFLSLVIVFSDFAEVCRPFGKRLRKSRHRRSKDASHAKQQRSVEAVDHIKSFVGTVAQGRAVKSQSGVRSIIARRSDGISIAVKALTVLRPVLPIGRRPVRLPSGASASRRSCSAASGQSRS